MKRTTGLMIVLTLVIGVYIGMSHGDKVSTAMKDMKTEFHIAYVDKVLGTEDVVSSASDAGPTDGARESDD